MSKTQKNDDRVGACIYLCDLHLSLPTATKYRSRRRETNGDGTTANACYDGYI